MTPVDETRMNTLAAMLADQKREIDDLNMEHTKARVALGRYRHSTATLAEDIERIVARLDGAREHVSPGLLSGAALRESALASHTRAGALQAIGEALKPGTDDRADDEERFLWREAALGAVRHGHDAVLAVRCANHVAAAWRERFGPKGDGK